MKQISFFAKVGGAGLGALGGFITFLMGLFSDKVMPGTFAVGLALFGICTYLAGVALENANFEELFPSNPQPSDTPSADQSFSNTQSYDAAQSFSGTQSYDVSGFSYSQGYDPTQSYSSTQSYAAPQNYSSTQSYAAPQAQPAYTAPQPSVSAGQQSFNESLNSANQAYASSQATSYSFDTPADPQ